MLRGSVSEEEKASRKRQRLTQRVEQEYADNRTKRAAIEKANGGKMVTPNTKMGKNILHNVVGKVHDAVVGGAMHAAAASEGVHKLTKPNYSRPLLGPEARAYKDLEKKKGPQKAGRF